MDAVDEFFYLWCEPEAWCGRCRELPAIHVVVQNNEEMSDSVVTYVRVWDPAAQAHIAICRQCSKDHIAILGTQAFAYAPPKSARQRPRRRRTFRRPIRQSLGRLSGHIRTWFLALLQGRTSPRREKTTPYCRPRQ